MLTSTKGIQPHLMQAAVVDLDSLLAFWWCIVSLTSRLDQQMQQKVRRGNLSVFCRLRFMIWPTTVVYQWCAEWPVTFPSHRCLKRSCWVEMVVTIAWDAVSHRGPAPKKHSKVLKNKNTKSSPDSPRVVRLLRGGVWLWKPLWDFATEGKSFFDGRCLPPTDLVGILCW